MRRASKVSRRRGRESEDVRARRRDSEERQTAKNKDGTENARRAATGKEQRVKRRRKKEREREKEEVGGDGERFHEESGWLTDDLIKRGTNYRPAGC